MLIFQPEVLRLNGINENITLLLYILQKSLLLTTRKILVSSKMEMLVVMEN